MNAFIAFQLSYCPLVWMFHSRTLNNRINTIHEKALRLVYKSETFLPFDDLLEKDKSVSIHQRSYNSLRQRSMRQKMTLDLKL